MDFKLELVGVPVSDIDRAKAFYVDRTSPLQPIRLVRTPGFGGAFLRHPIN